MPKTKTEELLDELEAMSTFDFNTPGAYIRMFIRVVKNQRELEERLALLEKRSDEERYDSDYGSARGG